MTTPCYRAFCSACQKELVAELSELEKYAVTKKHQESLRSVITTPISQMLFKDCHSDEVKRDHLSGLIPRF